MLAGCNSKIKPVNDKIFYMYSRNSGNNFDCFFKMGNDSFCYDFTNSKIYSDFSNKVVNLFRKEILENNDSFVISASEIDKFEIDSIVYYKYSIDGLTNFVYTKENTIQIQYNFDKSVIDTVTNKNNNKNLEKFKLVLQFFIKNLDKNPFHLDSKDQYKKPITDMMFYKTKNGKWDCVTIPYNSSYYDLFKTFLPI